MIFSFFFFFRLAFNFDWLVFHWFAIMGGGSPTASATWRTTLCYEYRSRNNNSDHSLADCDVSSSASLNFLYATNLSGKYVCGVYVINHFMSFEAACGLGHLDQWFVPPLKYRNTESRKSTSAQHVTQEFFASRNDQLILPMFAGQIWPKMCLFQMVGRG